MLQLPFRYKKLGGIGRVKGPKILKIIYISDFFHSDRYFRLPSAKRDNFESDLGRKSQLSKLPVIYLALGLTWVQEGSRLWGSAGPLSTGKIPNLLAKLGLSTGKIPAFALGVLKFGSVWFRKQFTRTQN